MTLGLVLMAMGAALLILGTGPWGVQTDYTALYQTFNSTTYYWGLYTNNHTPASSDSVSAYTELSASGYATQTTTAGSWTLTNQTTFFQATHSDLTFSWTGSATVYGYFVRDGSGNFIGAELFTGGPFSYGSGSNTLALSPKVTCGP